MIVDCSKNPMDLTPALDAIVERVAQALARRTDKTKPIILLMGEAHNSISHHVLQMLVTERLSRHYSTEPLAIGYEMVANFASHQVKQTRFLPLSPAYSKRLRDIYNQSDDIELVDDIFYGTEANSKTMCMESTFVLRAMQRARTQSYEWIDAPQLEFLGAAFSYDANLFPPRWACENPEKEKGMVLRNKAMVRNTGRHIQKLQNQGTSPSIYIVFTGMLHVLGGVHPSNYHNPNKSLLAEYRRQGYECVPIISEVEERMCMEIPLRMHSVLNKTGVFIRGVPMKPYALPNPITGGQAEASKTSNMRYIKQVIRETFGPEASASFQDEIQDLQRRARDASRRFCNTSLDSIHYRIIEDDKKRQKQKGVLGFSKNKP